MKKNEMNKEVKAVEAEKVEAVEAVEPEMVEAEKVEVETPAKESAKVEVKAENKVTEPVKAPVTPELTPEQLESVRLQKLEKRKADLLERLEKRVYKLAIKDLILLRSEGIEVVMKTQRTPSHTDKQALDIIESAIAGKSCGVITIGWNTTDNCYHIVNGGSRTTDFIKFFKGQLASKDLSFKGLTDEQKVKFLSHKLTIDWLVGTREQLDEDFKNYNNNKALTGGQKAITELGYTNVDLVKELASHEIFKKILSPRQIQNEEPNNIIILTLATIYDKYNAQTKKVYENVGGLDLSTLDINKLVYIMDKLVECEIELDKYKLIHLMALLYIGKATKSKNNVINFNVDDLSNDQIALISTVSFSKSGTNSADEQKKRIESINKKAFNVLSEKVATQTTVKADVFDPSMLDDPTPATTTESAEPTAE